MTKLIAIQERFDALAAEALEGLIEEVEKRDEVRAVALEVTLVPDPGAGPNAATVDVNLTVEPEGPGARAARKARMPGKRQLVVQPKRH